MTTIPEDARGAFERHDAYEPVDGAYRVASTVFDARVTAVETEGSENRYAITVTVPTLRGAVDGEVGSAVVDGWLEAFERRLADAPKATRATVELTAFDVAVDEATDAAVVEYGFAFGDADRAADVAKTFVEYVEGTYVEGVVPGYDYEPPVSDLLSAATRAGPGEERGPGGTPL